MDISHPLHIARIQVHVLRHPISTPVRTSFGVMHDRPAVFIRIEDTDGAYGWGEAWCNYPGCGAEHRGRLIETVLWPLLEGRAFDSPCAVHEHLSAETAVLAIQSGEPGPLAQAIAGLDLAMWDLCARRAGEPLWRFLGGTRDTIGVYASGLNPHAPEQLVARKWEEGFRAFKLKIGFEPTRDLENLRRIRDAVGTPAMLMADANQAWDLPTACQRVQALAEFELGWLEEPLRADRPWQEWRELATHTNTPLAAGENVSSQQAFSSLLDSGAVRIVQPDIAKWGGISDIQPLVRRIQKHGLQYFPHYLGGGIGLLHSAHLLAATGGSGWLEVDANDNPLRTRFCGRLATVGAGRVSLGNAPGIGIEPEL
ncbi:MAG: mandelate racemase/muconate lactonizing enzyme family protein [Alcaligenaceae bacterium]|nr:mandelate racemase/muconate lactonizing enzyme family protein [Alcaligenaceae bacterium SAGV5]MPS55099.1 mandelate racemase/muconate lactonizing enzyme family protein [Alcaligenaceae bacterium SAGV3]MPT59214.1 mandelate racemase/muconate lactonizing enzyme family protein [Alcaligenaceae bacterium]